MPVELHEEDHGRILAVKASGRLAKGDYEHFVPEVDRLIQQHGRISVLFEMHDFHGWGPGGLWEDTKFAFHHFGDIDRLAVVGEKRWQRGMAAFCKPFTKAQVRYFDQAHADQARAWLQKQPAHA